MNWRAFVRTLPVVGPLSYRLRPQRAFPSEARDPFGTSNEYWERRYALGGTSGAGSYNNLAEFKAEVLNDLVRRFAIKSVLEFGCGDGAQLALADYPAYTGVDISETVLRQVQERFRDQSHFSFFHASGARGLRAELALSLDVIYHLIEDDVFEAHMRSLFDASTRLVVIYASNVDAFAEVPHVRHRCFSDWIEANRPDFELIEMIPNRYPFDPARPNHTSFADFYVYRSCAE